MLLHNGAGGCRENPTQLVDHPVSCPFGGSPWITLATQSDLDSKGLAVSVVQPISQSRNNLEVNLLLQLYHGPSTPQHLGSLPKEIMIHGCTLRSHVICTNELWLHQFIGVKSTGDIVELISLYHRLIFCAVTEP